MTHFVRRTCTEIGEDGSPVGSGRSSNGSTDGDDGSELDKGWERASEHSSNGSTDWNKLPSEDTPPAESGASRTLDDFRESDAYVLLGAPGAGKTRTFEREAAGGEGGHYVTARDFITLGVQSERDDATLFIDGLDEMRAGSSDGRTPLDKIRARLDTLGRPRFRLSCREADWFGANDRTHLERVSKSGKVTILRLDPLTEDGIREFLGHHPGIEDASGFIAAARERGIDALLANPQSLRMLADAVSGGSWPESRTETFDLACERLVREQNPEHSIANRNGPSESDRLNVAGRLCAVQLLAGGAGYALTDDRADDDSLGLTRISGVAQETLRDAVSTRLFESVEEGRAVPIHRHIAEFLAARYLAQRIDEGLPVGRVLALMTGGDGGVVSELRGLSAWLAVHCKASRAEIIDRDPLGTVLYGDVRGFSPDEKLRILRCLDRETRRNPWFIHTLPADSRMEGLATPDMAQAFQEHLTDPARDTARQSFVCILLESLKYGQAIPGLGHLLMNVVRDGQWHEGIRRLALSVLIWHPGDDVTTADRLRTLLADVHAGSVSDPDDELLGTLLCALYPRSLSAVEIARHLKDPRNPNFYGAYWRFWNREVLEKSSAAQLARLLDAVAERFARLRHVSRDNPQRLQFPIGIAHHLLVRFLDTMQETMSPNDLSDRLFDWLEVVSNPYLGSGQSTGFITSWLTAHPDLQKAIIATGAARCAGSSDFPNCMYHIERRLFRAARPADFGSWCLEQAIAATERDIESYFIEEVAKSVHYRRYDEGLSRSIVEERLADSACLLNPFAKRLADLERRDAENDASEKNIRKEDEAQRRRDQQAWHDVIKLQQAALRENRCSPALLHQLAAAYFGWPVNVEGDTPVDRLRSLFGDDEELIEAVLDGLRGSVTRDDVPGVSEIMRLRSAGRRHYLVLPFLAGLDELARTASPKEVLPDDERIRRALAFHYHSGPADQRPDWYEWALKSHPDAVADILVQSARAGLRAGKTAPDLYRLQDSEQVARLATPSLLEIFPVRCTVDQLQELGYLLGAAFRCCETASFRKLIDHKLSHRSMNVAQRVYWLGAGLLASMSSGRERLEEYVTGQERRIRSLGEFAASVDLLPALLERQDVPALQLLIRLIGASYGPDDHDALPMSISGRVRACIDRLASATSSAATEAFQALLDDDGLRAWHPCLVDAADRQSAVRREADFRYPDVGRILGVLDHRGPANAADLAALTYDLLAEIARNIRDGNTNDWRQYWNHGGKDQRWEPKDENDCRDALLSDLQSRMMQLGIDATPEGRYADEKRSDIRVSFGGCNVPSFGSFNVPVEIKKSSHRDVWTAIRSQLIPKYARDPGADGYGIYLVFWFGRERCQPPESGVRPENAAQLESRLRDTLSEKEARRISVLVVDVAQP